MTAQKLYYMAVWRDRKKIEILNNDGSRMFLTWTEALAWRQSTGKGVEPLCLSCPHKTEDLEASDERTKLRR